MNIQTKFAPGDMWRWTPDNKVQLLEIITAEIRVGPSDSFAGNPNVTTIRYWLKIGGESCDRVEPEANLFATKAELLASL